MRRLKFEHGFKIMAKLLAAALIIGSGPLIIHIKAGAEIIAVEGEVYLKSGKAEVQPVRLLDPTPAGATIKTMEHGKAKLFFKPDCVIILSENTALEVIDYRDEGKAAAEKVSLRLLQGKIRFITAINTPGAYLQIVSPATAVQASRADGVMALAQPDRIICLKDSSTILVKNRSSAQQRRIQPLEMAISTLDGGIKVEKVAAGLAEQCLKENSVTLAAPPPQLVRQVTPRRTPITLHDQVRFPWPVFPPVKNTPNLW
jgi:hypothetical protein